MATKEARHAAPLKEIHFSDEDAGARLPAVKDPGEVAPAASADERRTLVEWAKLAGDFAPPIPPGGYRHRGERHRGRDVRVLLFHLRMRGKYVIGETFTRAQYDAAWRQLDEETAMRPSSAMRDAVEAVVPYRGGFVTKEEHAALVKAGKET